MKKSFKNWSAASDDALIDALRWAWTEMPSGLVEEILSRGEKMLEPLSRQIQAVVEADPNEGCDEEDEWGARHAFVLLALIGSPKAVGPMLDYFRCDSDWTEIVSELGDKALAALGAEAIAPIKDYLFEIDRDPMMRSTAFDALIEIGRLNENKRPEITSILTSVITAYTEIARSLKNSGENAAAFDEIADFLAMASMSAASVDDEALQNAIDSAYQERIANNELIEYSEIKKIRYKGKLWFCEKSPLSLRDAVGKAYMETFADFYEDVGEENIDEEELDYDFEPPKNYKRLQPNASDRFAAEIGEQTPAKREAPKVGRNDKCPCGSGMKYKKCCGK